MPLTIGDLAQRAGTRASTIRYWEKMGVLPAPPRAGGRRQYSAEALVRVEMVRLGKEAGFTLGELRSLLGPDPGLRAPGWRVRVRRKRREVECHRRALERAYRLLGQALACGCRDLRACVGRKIARRETIPTAR